MRKLYIPALALIILAFSGCVVTTASESTSSALTQDNGTAPSSAQKYGIHQVSHYQGSSYSAGNAEFSPERDMAVLVIGYADDFFERRSLEESIAAALGMEGINCVLFTDNYPERLLSDLSEEEISVLLVGNFLLENMQYIIALGTNEASTYTLGGGIAHIRFDLFSKSIWGDSAKLTGSLYIEETSGNEIRESYLTSWSKVSGLAGELAAKEYLKYCPEIVEEQDIEQ